MRLGALGAGLAVLILILTSCSAPDADLANPKSSPSVETVVLKLGFNQDHDHPQYQASVKLAERLLDATDGRYTIKVYDNEQLGSQEQVLQNISRGTVDLAFISSPLLEEFNPDFGIYSLPYIFDSEQAQVEVLKDEETNRMLYDSMSADHNLSVLAGVWAGTRSIYTVNRAVNSPADLAGLKIRVENGVTPSKTMELFGAQPVKMTSGDTYQGLTTGSIDGAENNEGVYYWMHHGQSAKFYSLTEHAMVPDFLVASSKALDAMSSEDLEVFYQLVGEAQDEINAAMPSYLSDAQASAEEAGSQFVEVDKESFKALTSSYVDEFVSGSTNRENIYAAIQLANQGLSLDGDASSQPSTSASIPSDEPSPS